MFIFGLAESSTYGFGSVRSWGPTLAGVLLIASWFVHSWRSPNPLIDLRTFAHTRAGAAAGVFFLFAISVFGSMLLSRVMSPRPCGVTTPHSTEASRRERGHDPHTALDPHSPA